LAPPWLGVFDEARIAFVPFHDMLPIFTETDFNWNATPSNHETADFQKARRAVERTIGAKIAVYNFGADDREIKEFIKTHIGAEGSFSIKSPITKDNFVQIFIKWVKEVKPSINISKEKWQEFKAVGVLDGDFFRADMMSSGGNAVTLTDKLKIILENDKYKYHQVFEGDLFSRVIDFTDGGEAYRRFWNKYERPPAEQYQKYIIERPDLLVPQNIRETKGSFFTPSLWVKKSREYLAKVFGDNWQEEYYVWDCAAGTGNLLAGLTNKYNVWASTIDETDVNTINTLIDIDDSLDLLPSHVFQFDFLNDGFDKLPEGLRNIIDDPEKRKKLIVYINPPYAEAASATTRTGTGQNKRKVSTAHKTSQMYKETLGRGINELFANFFIKIYYQSPGVKLAAFSTLKYINSQNFIKFRECFLAEYKAGFMCRANTFDNVEGKFPIGFLIWDLMVKKQINGIRVDVFESDNYAERCRPRGEKIIYTAGKGRYIVDWMRSFFDAENERIGYLRFQGTDFQTNSNVYLTNRPSANDIRESKITNITGRNITGVCVYLAVRQCIEHTWLNDRDQFLFPNDGWKTDAEFQHNCLVFTLFHGQNRISAKDGGATGLRNHWIPFTEKEVDAKEKFESNFMSEFLKGKTFSNEARAVLDAGRELWRYYHAKIRNNGAASANASFYDIREFFQGRKESGTMNAKSADETYNALIAALRAALKTLAAKIAPKVYEYGFLKE
ncbi:MAG: hypothetical protein LBC53_07400, partial [Spirochaetaceae bacterium]|nr:hypothetical protein [Spirochaetaceae bacterium]